MPNRFFSYLCKKYCITMFQEIERKFLVRPLAPSERGKCGDFKAEAFKATDIIQGYLSHRPTVRVRIKGDMGYLTIKGPVGPSGLSRFEWEKEITKDEALALLQLAEPGRIEKTRYLVKNTDGIHTWEVDEFHGDNEGLVMAEIELSSEADTFDKPAWIGKEVTGDPRYYNSYLMKHPTKEWK